MWIVKFDATGEHLKGMNIFLWICCSIILPFFAPLFWVVLIANYMIQKSAWDKSQESVPVPPPAPSKTWRVQ